MPRVARPVLAAVLILLGLGLARAEESWDAIYFNGQKSGHIHVRVEPVKDKNGRELLRVRVDWELNLRRDKDIARMKLLYGTIETRDGTVLRLDTRTQAGQSDIRTYGDVIDGRMVLKMNAGGREEQQEIAWPPDVRGPYGAEMSLARDKIQPGQTRDVKTFIPSLNKICTTRLKAVGVEEVPLGPKAEPRTLLRVEQEVFDDRGEQVPGTRTTLWVDSTGQIMKAHMDMLGGVDMYRTSKAGALANDGSAPFDLLAGSIIRFSRKLNDSERTRDVVYQVSIAGEDPLKVFPNDHRQTVRAGSAKGTALIEVRTDGPASGPPGPAQVDAQFLRPNALINSDDPVVISHTEKAVRGKVNPWERAVAIEEYVARNMREKNFSTAFAPAREVARELSGDCTEHGVLAAAMFRAAGIPSRCVIGLAYTPRYNGLGLHMWNEVYVNGRWVALDATFNQSQVDATHIKVSDTSLDGVDHLSAFLPVTRLFGSVKIEPVEIR